MEEKKIVKKVDGEGSALALVEGLYKGITVYYPAGYAGIPQLLTTLENNFVPQENDVWLLTYLKAGTHWMYEIIGILQSGMLEPLKEFKESLMLEYFTDVSSLDRGPSPRTLNTHLRVKYLPKDVLEKNKIVCVIRNPKSVAVSLYFHSKGLKSYEYNGQFSGFLPLFVEGCYNIHGNWFDHVTECWDELKEKPNVHFVFYEELKKNPVEVIYVVSKFLGLERTREFCEGVVQLTSFDNMKMSKGKKKDLISAFDGRFKSTDNGFFRKGTIDDWKNYFTVRENESFMKVYQEQMKHYPELRSKIEFE